jgi:hypothetical protein
MLLIEAFSEKMASSLVSTIFMAQVNLYDLLENSAPRI